MLFKMCSIFNLIIDSIFTGTAVLVSCLLMLYLLKIKFRVVDKSTLIQAVNLTLLFGSTLFTVDIATQLITGFFSGSEDVRYATLNQFFGPYWWAFWLVMAPGYFLPQILWIKRLRKTIMSSVIFIGIGSVLILFVKLASNNGDFYLKYTSLEYLTQAVIYFAILSAMYLVLNRRMALSKA
jgi:hypothetical protein